MCYKILYYFPRLQNRNTSGEDVLYLSWFYFPPTSDQGTNQDMEGGGFCQSQYAYVDVCITNYLLPTHIIKRQFLD